ncbi:MAG: acyltransferase [Bacteroidetes bacterium]|nr:acyltransferase [Bacteroidota bacterium]
MTKEIKLSSDSYFPALTGIRAVAASMIFLHHYNILKPAWVGQLIHDSIDEFHIGVTIFFVLSGFLICFRYYDFVQLGRKWIWRYFVNRFARIYPTYFLVTIISFIPGICLQYCSLKVLFLNLTFLRGFFDEYKATGAPGGWSLTVEEIFYFLFPLLVLGSKKIRLLLQPLIFIAIGILLWMIFRNVSFHGFFSSLQFVFEFTFFGRCFEFYTGIMLALFVKSRSKINIETRVPYRTVAGIMYIIICLVSLVMNRRHSTDASQFLFFETLINNFLMPPGIAVLFFGLIVEKTWIQKILSSALFIVLGRSSYIFYLIHNGVLFVFLYTTLHINTAIIFVIIHLISITLYFGAEKPLNKLIRRAAL